MKRTLLALTCLLVVTTTTFAQDNKTVVPLANGHSLFIYNPLKPEYWQFFNNADLGTFFDQISEAYGLSTDITVRMLFMANKMQIAVQGIEIDPLHAPLIAPSTMDGEVYLPLTIFRDATNATAEWVSSFIWNKATPSDLANMVRTIAYSSPVRVTCAITNKGQSITAIVDMMGLNALNFDSKILWSDSSGRYKSEIITLPTYPLAKAKLMQGQFVLEAPEDPKDKAVLKNTIVIYKFFGLR